MVYGNSNLQNTAMQRWSLVCDNDNYFKTISQSVYFAGHLFGTLIAGYLADRYGRKRAFIITLFPAIGLTLGSYFIDHPYAWMGIRFLVGVTQMAATTTKTVYVVSYNLIESLWTNSEMITVTELFHEMEFSVHHFSRKFIRISSRLILLFVILLS